MKYTRVNIAAIGYELPPNVVRSITLEQRLAAVYRKFGIPLGQLEAMTGIRERRYWNPGQTMADGATAAGRKTLSAARFDPGDVEILIYAGVCRDNLEPATATAVADGLGIGRRSEVYDISNACLGVLNGMVQIANAIEVGAARAGLVVSCESARHIVDQTIMRLLDEPNLDLFKTSLATLTGGSGAVGVLLTERTLAPNGHALLGGVARSDCRHHKLCRWGPVRGLLGSTPQVMETHAIDVLNHGVALGATTFQDFVRELGWQDTGPDRIICHQVGATNRESILRALDIPPQRDYSTFETLGNIGTVSLPITAALAQENGFLHPGDRVGLLGIGSGLNCLMLGAAW